MYVDPGLSSNLTIIAFIIFVVIALAVFIFIRSYRKASKKAKTAASSEPVTVTPPGYAPPVTISPPSDLKIFISYRRSDSADVTGRIYDRLVEYLGREAVFKDVDNIPLGADFRQHINQMIEECNHVLVVIGRGWIDAKYEDSSLRLHDPRDFVRIEIEAALEKDVPIIPLLVGGAHMPADVQLPDSIKELAFRNGIPIRPDPDFHNDMDRLISGLE